MITLSRPLRTFVGISIALWLAVGAGCDGAASSGDDDGGLAGDGDGAIVWGDGGAGGGDGGGSTDDGGAGVRCSGAGEACAGRVTDDGRCDGVCIVPRTEVACAGIVVDGLCEGSSVRPPESDVHDGDGLRIEATRVPDRAHPGEEHAFEVAFTNTGDAARTIVARFALAPAWEHVSGAIGDDAPSTLALEAGEMRVVAGVLRARRANVVEHDRWAFAVTVDGLAIDRRGLRVRTPVYDDEDGVACGGEHYPSTYASEGGAYFHGMCCGGVFYPAASCCDASDCEGSGQCADGVCIADAPWLGFASAPAGGRFCTLVVWLDDRDAAPDHPLCEPVDARTFPVDLEGVANDWRTMTAERLGRTDVIDFDWTVLTGLTQEDLGIDAYDTSVPGLRAIERAAEAALVEAGCIASFEADYDRVVVYVPAAGTTNVVYDPDRISLTATEPIVLVHELAHTFGATDLYNDLGGAWQWAGSLAGAGTRALRPDVTFAEVGWSDTDRDGQIDAYQWVRAPTEIVITRLEALDTGSELQLRVEVAGVEGDRTGRVLLRHLEVALPSESATRTIDVNATTKDVGHAVYRAYFVPPLVDLEAIRAAGEVEVRLTGAHHGTTASGARVHAVLDETRVVAVVDASGRAAR